MSRLRDWVRGDREDGKKEEPKPGETTAEHFAAFKDECQRWIKYFGLTEWEVVFAHEDVDDHTRADITTTQSARIAKIRLSKNWSNNPDGILCEQTVRKSAFHEVCELLLSEINLIASCRFGYDEIDLEAAKHAIIRRLENTLFKGVIP